MSQELLQLVIELERAVTARDAQGCVELLRSLNKETIYSENEAYGRLREIERPLAVVLYEGLETPDFIEQLPPDNLLWKYEMWNALEEISERVSEESIWQIGNSFQFPSQHMQPKLHAKIVGSGLPELTGDLIARIDRLSAKENANGTDLSHHQRSVSTFMLRWSPDDKRLSEYVELLASRRDACAVSACQRYLMELPWGKDRQATVALLDAMSRARLLENQEAFVAALDVYVEPINLRCWLWGSICDLELQRGLSGLFNELRKSGADADRITIIDFLDNVFAEIEEDGLQFDRARIATEAENLETRKWSIASRGYYGNFLTTHVQQADPRKVSSRIDRAAISLARAGEAVRVDHMGCLMLVPMLVVVFLLPMGLGLFLGEPVRFGWLSPLLFSLWVASSILNMRTHFSGHETIGRKILDGAIYFGLLVLAIVAAVVSRIG